MRSALAGNPNRQLVEEPLSGAAAGGTDAEPPVSAMPSPRPPKRAAIDPVASAAEVRASKRAAVEHLLNEAMTPPRAAPAKPARALGVADRAVAPLADTLAAIDAAQRVVVENLRNVEAAGFKASRTACGDGRDVASQLDLAQGELQSTGRPLDVGIQGDGFFEVQVYTPDHPNGTVGFTRNGRLFVAKDGTLVVGQGDGYQLIPPLKVPVGTTALAVEQDGNIRATAAGATNPATGKPMAEVVGRLTLARFTDPSALRPLGGGLYAETEASGHAVDSAPAERGAGAIMQGYVEASNVDLTRERMRLRFLQAWRATILAAVDGDAAEPAGQSAVKVGPQKQGRNDE